MAHIYTLARRLAGPEQAEELTQDIFVRAWSKLQTYRGDAAFGTWLYRLALNLILGQLSATRRDRFSEDPAVAEQLAVRKGNLELAIDFGAALERLPYRAREVGHQDRAHRTADPELRGWPAGGIFPAVRVYSTLLWNCCGFPSPFS